jgi:hypothetical protein
MGQPSWREIKRVNVPDGQPSIWTPALDYVRPGKLYRILVEANSETVNSGEDAFSEEGSAAKEAPAKEAAANEAAAKEVAAKEAAAKEAAAKETAAKETAAKETAAKEAAAKETAASEAAANEAAKTLPQPATRSAEQRWTPESAAACTADGDPTLTRSSALTVESSAVGALIAKIGGSTADLKPDKDKLILFSVGRHCVFSISDASKAGALYLGMNDTYDSQAKLEGELQITIYEAL